MNTRIKLPNLPLGTSGVMTPFKDSNDPRVTSLMEMGLIPGTTITPKFHGPFGKDPIAVEVRGSLVGIGKELASLIEVEVSK